MLIHFDDTKELSASNSQLPKEFYVKSIPQHGVLKMKIPTYVLAVKNHQKGELQLALGGERTADMPVCFSPDYAAHLFNFSESRVQCDEGDSVFLLKGDVDISEIEREDDFPEAFKKLLQDNNDLNDWTVLRQKSAVSVKSQEYKQKVRADLEQTHRLLQMTQLLM